MDATITETRVPANSKPNFELEDGAAFVPVNGEYEHRRSHSALSPLGLTEVRQSYDHYCIIGAGKTGVDGILYLLTHGVHPDKIMWVVPNDVWYLNRKFFTFDKDLAENTFLLMKNIASDENKSWTDAVLR